MILPVSSLIKNIKLNLGITLWCLETIQKDLNHVKILKNKKIKIIDIYTEKR